MEHRWGQRSNLRVAVQLRTDGSTEANGYLQNVSISGAFVHTRSPALIGALLELEVPLGNGPGHLLPRAAAYVTRRTSEGIGVEWCNLAPPLALALLGNHRLEVQERLRAGDGLRNPDASQSTSSGAPHTWREPPPLVSAA